jgi:hypothetical protein
VPIVADVMTRSVQTLPPDLALVDGEVSGRACSGSQFYNPFMLHKKNRKEPDIAIHASVKKELAKPRMAKSARIAELNLDITRIPEQPSTSMPGTVDKIIPSPPPSQPENVQISVDGPDHRSQDLRIENTLTNEHGDEVRLKKRRSRRGYCHSQGRP